MSVQKVTVFFEKNMNKIHLSLVLLDIVMLCCDVDEKADIDDNNDAIQCTCPPWQNSLMHSW